MAEIEIDRTAAERIITALPSSDLVRQFNEILVDRLVEFDVESLAATRFADRVLITGIPLAMQGIEKSAFRNKCLERVKLLPRNNKIQNDWLRKWAEKFGGDRSSNPDIATVLAILILAISVDR